MARTVYITAGEIAYVGGTILERYGKDITGDSFQIAVSATGNPPTSGWLTPDISVIGTEVVNMNGVSIPITSQRQVLLLASSTLPTGSPFVAGSTYSVWVKVQDHPETPVRLLEGGVVAV